MLVGVGCIVLVLRVSFERSLSDVSPESGSVPSDPVPVSSSTDGMVSLPASTTDSNFMPARLVFAADFSSHAGCADHGTDDHCDLFSADIDLITGLVSNVRQLTNTATTSEAYPVWNPNGMVAYASVYQTSEQRSLNYVDISTGKTGVLLAGARWPEVSPDGKTLLYVTDDNDVLMEASLSDDGLSMGTTTPLTGIVRQDDPEYSADGQHVIFHQIRSDGAHGVVLNLANGKVATYKDGSGHCAFGPSGSLTVCDNAKGGGIFAETFANDTLSDPRLFTPDLRPSVLAEYDNAFVGCGGTSFNYPNFCGDDQHLLVSTSCNMGASQGVTFSRLFLIDLSGSAPVYRPIGKELAEQFNGAGKSSWTVDCLVQ